MQKKKKEEKEKAPARAFPNVQMTICLAIKDGARRKGCVCSASKRKNRKILERSLAESEISEVCGSKSSIKEAKDKDKGAS